MECWAVQSGRGLHVAVLSAVSDAQLVIPVGTSKQRRRRNRFRSCKKRLFHERDVTRQCGIVRSYDSWISSCKS